MRRQVLLLMAIVASTAQSGRAAAGPRADSTGTVVESTFRVTGTVTDNGYFPIAGADTDTRLAATRTKLTTLGTYAGGTNLTVTVLPQP